MAGRGDDDVVDGGLVQSTPRDRVLAAFSEADPGGDGTIRHEHSEVLVQLLLHSRLTSEQLENATRLLGKVIGGVDAAVPYEAFVNWVFASHPLPLPVPTQSSNLRSRVVDLDRQLSVQSLSMCRGSLSLSNSFSSSRLPAMNESFTVSPPPLPNSSGPASRDEDIWWERRNAGNLVDDFMAEFGDNAACIDTPPVAAADSGSSIVPPLPIDSSSRAPSTSPSIDGESGHPSMCNSFDPPPMSYEQTGEMARYKEIQAAHEAMGATKTAGYAEVLRRMAVCLGTSGRHDAAMELYRQAKSVFEAAGATSTREYLDLLKSMAARLRQKGHREETAALYREVQAVSEAMYNVGLADSTDPGTDDTSDGIVCTSLTPASLEIPPPPVI